MRDNFEWAVKCQTSVFGCEITVDGLHICDNTSLSWQAQLLLCFFFPFSPLFPHPILQAERRLGDSRGDSFSDSHFVWPTYLTTGRAERSRGGGSPETISTLSADYISNLPDWIFNPALVFDKGSGGISIDSATKFNFVTVRRRRQAASNRRRPSHGVAPAVRPRTMSLHRERSVITQTRSPPALVTCQQGQRPLKVRELAEEQLKRHEQAETSSVVLCAAVVASTTFNIKPHEASNRLVLFSESGAVRLFRPSRLDKEQQQQQQRCFYAVPIPAKLAVAMETYRLMTDKRTNELGESWERRRQRGRERRRSRRTKEAIYYRRTAWSLIMSSV